MFKRSCVIEKAMPTGQKECLLRLNNYIATIVFNRPARKNAFGRVLASEFLTNLDYCMNNTDVRCVLVTSEVPKIFCAGADLKERKEMTPEEARNFVNTLRTALCNLEDLNVPTIAVVEGHALGGGLELALATDMRIAAEGALLGVPETSLAIIPGAGGTQRLAKVIGTSRAKEMTFTAKPVTAERAAEIGLVNYTLPAGGAALEKALQIAGMIAQNGPIAVSAAKVAITEGYGKPRDEGMAVERAQYEKVLASKDRLEGLKAFAEKRKPEYKGE